MSNDKSSAASHPEDWRTAQQRFEDAMAQVRSVVRATPEEVALMEQGIRELYVATDARTRYAAETTGEHIHHKLADDLYQDFVDPRDVPEHHHELPEMSDAQVERLYEMVTHRGPGPSKMLTPAEITMALKIVGSIVLLFVFVVIFYRW